MGLYVGDTKYKPIIGGVGYKVVRELPYDAEIEYLESTGTQWIDTGFSPDINTLVNVVCSINSHANQGVVLGARVFPDDNGRFFPFASSNSTTARFTVGTIQFLINVNYGARTIYTIVFNDSSHRLLVNGESLGSFTGTNFVKTQNNNLLLFGTSGYGSNHYCSKSNIYTCTIIHEGTTVRDFIPVRIGTTGYMYDKVSGQLFGNAGTGDFILGNDKN